MRSFVRPVVALGLLMVLLIAGLAGISQLKFASFLSDSIEGRLEVVATSAAQDFAAAVDLGLSLDEVANGQAILDRARKHDSAIEAVYVIDQEGAVLHAAGTAPNEIDSKTLESFDLARTGVTGPVWGSESDEIIRSGSLIQGSFSQPVGAIVVEYPKTEMNGQTRSMAGRLVINGLAVVVGLCIAGAVGLWVFRSRLKVNPSHRDGELAPSSASGVDPDPDSALERTSGRLGLSISLLLVVGVAFFGISIVREFNRELAPELERRAALIGETISDDIERAVDVGIPIDELVGVGEYLDVFLNEFAELDFLEIQGDQGLTLYAAGSADGGNPLSGKTDSIDYTFGVQNKSQAVGAVVVGVDGGWVQSRLDDLALDIVVILLVALVVAFELTRVLSTRIAAAHDRVTADSHRPVATGDRVGDMRIVLFLFVVGEELNKSFLPLFIQSADNPIAGLDPTVAISLPIVAYLLTIAITSPVAGRLINRLGNRGLFAIGVVPAALSHLGMAYADDVVQIIALRSLTGVGYALVTIAAMEYILDHSSTDARAKGISVFVAVIIGGTFAGTALGGIFADRLGFDAVFRISFGLVVVAGVLGLLTMKQPPVHDTNAPDSFTIRNAVVLLKQRSLLLLMAGVTVPMNVLMAAFLWYLVPLTMASVGSSASAIARTLMVYYLIILMGGPLVAKLAERRASYRTLVGMGSVISGVALLLPAFSLSALSISVAVLFVGIGHAAVRGPQIALALDIANTELPGTGRGPVLAAMRSIERLGSLAGLLIVAILAAWFNLALAVGAIGVASAAAGLVYLMAGPPVVDLETIDA